MRIVIHYPVLVPTRPARTAFDPAPCPIADTTRDDVLSLPLHPTLSDEEAHEVVPTVNAFGPRGRTPCAATPGVRA